MLNKWETTETENNWKIKKVSFKRTNKSDDKQTKYISIEEATENDEIFERYEKKEKNRKGEFHKFSFSILDNSAHSNSNQLDEEREQLKAEFNAAINELRLRYQNEQKSKAKLQEEYAILKEQYEKAAEALEYDRNLDVGEAKKRLQILEKQFVGGEQVGYLV